MNGSCPPVPLTIWPVDPLGAFHASMGTQRPATHRQLAALSLGSQRPCCAVCAGLPHSVQSLLEVTKQYPGLQITWSWVTVAGHGPQPTRAQVFSVSGQDRAGQAEGAQESQGSPACSQPWDLGPVGSVPPEPLW